MINLLMAIMLGNYDKARKFSEKRKIFDAIELLSKGIDQTNNVNLFDGKNIEDAVKNETMSKIMGIVLDKQYSNPIIKKIFNNKEEVLKNLGLNNKL
jgi:hypothetical protein